MLIDLWSFSVMIKDQRIFWLKYIQLGFFQATIVMLRLKRRLINPAAREGDQADCAHTTRSQPPPPSS